MKYYADALMDCGQYQEALKYYMSALNMGKKVLLELPRNFGKTLLLSMIYHMSMMAMLPEG